MIKRYDVRQAILPDEVNKLIIVSNDNKFDIEIEFCVWHVLTAVFWISYIIQE
jgi:hypothetical protein